MKSFARGTMPPPIDDGGARGGRSSSSGLPLPFFLVAVRCILLVATLVRFADAGISLGTVASTDACYSALRNAEMTDGTERVDKDGYVDFVNDMSNDALVNLRYDDVTNEWGYFPITSFEELPPSMRGAFYAVACGGAFVACEGAHLRTSGTRDGADPGEIAYLFGLCTGVEDAIDMELAHANHIVDDDDNDDDDGDEDSVASTMPLVYPSAIPTFDTSIVETTTVPTNAVDGGDDDLVTSMVPSQFPSISTTSTATPTFNTSTVETTTAPTDADDDGGDDLETSTVPSQSPSTSATSIATPTFNTSIVETTTVPTNADDDGGDDPDTSAAPSQSPSTLTTPIVTPTFNTSTVETTVPTNADDDDGNDLDTSTAPSQSLSEIPTATATPNASFVATVVPTTGPTATASDVLASGREIIVLTYRAVVSENVSSDELNGPDDSLRMQLLGAMSTWTNVTVSEFDDVVSPKASDASLFTRRVEATAAEETSGKAISLRGLRWKSEGRGLTVRSEFSLKTGGISSMEVFDVECSGEIKIELQLDSDHCIEIATNVILNFAGEPPGLNRTDAIIGIRSNFALDVENGGFHEILARSTESAVRFVYLETARFDIDSFLEDEEKDTGEEWGGSNAAGIAAGLCLGLVAVGMGSFIVYRRRSSSVSFLTDDKSHEDSKTEFYSSESCATPDSDIGGAVNPFSNWQIGYDSSINQKTSSLDQELSVESDDDSSIGLFSRIHDSDESTTSSGESSVEKAEGIEDASHGSSTYHDFSLWFYDKSIEEGIIPRSDTSDIVGVNALPNRVKGSIDKKAPLNQVFSGENDDNSDESTTSSSENSVAQSKGSKDASSGSLIVSGAETALTTTSDVDVGRPSPKHFFEGTRDEPNSPRDNDVDDSDDSSTFSNEGSASIEERMRESNFSNSSTIFPLNTEKLWHMIKQRGWDSTSLSSKTSVDEKWEGDSTLLSSDIEANVDATAVNITLPNSSPRSPTDIKIRGWDSTSSSSSSYFAKRWERDSTPLGSDIEAGVATTALPKSNARLEYKDDDRSTSDSSAYNFGRVRESASATVHSDAALAAELAQLMKSGNWDAVTVDSDVARDAEIDQLIKSGNWEGIVAVAARYGEEADRAADQLRQPPRNHGTAHILSGAL